MKFKITITAIYEVEPIDWGFADDIDPNRIAKQIEKNFSEDNGYLDYIFDRDFSFSVEPIKDETSKET